MYMYCIYIHIHINILSLHISAHRISMDIHHDFPDLTVRPSEHRDIVPGEIDGGGPTRCL